MYVEEVVFAIRQRADQICAQQLIKSKQNCAATQFRNKQYTSALARTHTHARTRYSVDSVTWRGHDVRVVVYTVHSRRSLTELDRDVRRTSIHSRTKTQSNIID